MLQVIEQAHPEKSRMNQLPTSLTDDAIALSIADAKGAVLLTTPLHGLILGREADEIVGRNWREWCPRQELEVVEEHYARCNAGEPMSFMRHIRQPTGFDVRVRVHIFAAAFSRQQVNVGIIRTLPLAAAGIRPEVVETVEYNSNVVDELSSLAFRVGLSGTYSVLRDVATNMDELAELLFKSMPKSA